MKKFATVWIALPLLLIISCSGGNDKQKKAEADYLRSMDDSIAVLNQEIDSCNSAIQSLRTSEDIWLHDFTTVSNPREAAPYIIYSAAKDKYPPKSTGLLARLADNGQFELIASLTGGTFDQIVVESSGESISSEVIPPDQALNYTAGGLNTVLFTGPSADSIGQLIADNDLSTIKLIFMKGKPVNSINIPQMERTMIMASYQFYAAQKEINRLERRIPMLANKIKILRVHKDRLNNNLEDTKK